MICVSRTSLFTVASVLILVVLVLALELPRRHGEEIHRTELGVIRALEKVHGLERAYLRAGGDTGRFAYLQELDHFVELEPLRNAQGGADAGGRVSRRPGDLVQSGYRFRVYLPNADGHGVGFSKRQEVNLRQARQHFACYAWPEVFASTGRRTFLLLADGTILSTENQRWRYEGAARAPRPGAGFMAADPGSIVDPPAVKPGAEKGRGIDGQLWVRFTRSERQTGVRK